jgi:hypothetical protein
MAPLEKSIIDLNQWPIIMENYGPSLEIYLKTAQEILEIQYGYLFTGRSVFFQWIPQNKPITIPIGFLKSLLSADPVNGVKIIDGKTVEAQAQEEKSIITIEYDPGFINNGSIQWAVIKKAIDLFNLSLGLPNQ